MEKKYCLGDAMIKLDDNEDLITLHQIVALKDFGDVKRGYMGGYIEKESNLSQSGNCWVYPDGAIYGDARIEDDVEIYDSVVKDNARIRGNTKVYGSIIYDNAEIFGPNIVISNCAIAKDAYIDKSNSFVCISPVGPIKNMTFYTNKDGDIIVNCSNLNLNGPIKEIEDILINDPEFSNNELYVDAIVHAISFVISILHHTKVKTTITREYEEYNKEE